MTGPPSYDDLMAALARERLHNPWWTSVPKATTTDDASGRRNRANAYPIALVTSAVSCEPTSPRTS